MKKRLYPEHLGHTKDTDNIVFVVSENEKDYYLRHNGMKYVVDMRGSNNPADYTTIDLNELWGIHKFKHYPLERIMSFKTLMKLTNSKSRIAERNLTQVTL